MRLPAPLRVATHPLARQARLLGRGPGERRSEGLFLVEGPRGLDEALAAGVAPAWVMVAAERVGDTAFAALVARCLEAGVLVQPVQGGLLGRLVPTERGPGLVAACPLPAGADRLERVLDPPRDGLVVVAWELQNPGNLGTLVRSAAAFGAQGVIAAGGADPWNPKCVRASAGAIHRLPVARATAEVPEGLAARAYRLVAAVPRHGAAPASIDWNGRVALLLGSEVAGLPDALGSAALRLTIPMQGSVESLSVGVAGSLILFAAAVARRSGLGR